MNVFFSNRACELVHVENVIPGCQMYVKFLLETLL